MTVLVLNGPNLNRLGKRDPTVYGSRTYDELAALCRHTGADHGLDVDVRQTNSEAVMIDWLHEAAEAGSPVVINAGAWTHTSIAIRDAAEMLTAPLIEVHISNVHQRQEFRHHSYLSDVATGVIVGLGFEGYVAALGFIASQLDSDPPG
ncbi:3-dehydroquinate dehydratase-2 [Mumia flava]|uniref:3-dehydroquinate dehydratase n=1 Tax=Mumia flava TaxID=1348852 RepID=A0A0B2BSV5_9ACTN|nr:type II 3-dehydroquinate dehydratase [Mumia flava]PJJ57231.1 3-dehydroquinate dehydratase-2 [Mumia flava]